MRPFSGRGGRVHPIPWPSHALLGNVRIFMAAVGGLVPTDGELKSSCCIPQNTAAIETIVCCCCAGTYAKYRYTYFTKVSTKACSVLYCTLPYSTVLFYTEPYRTIHYHTVPYSTVLYCMAVGKQV